MPDPHDKPAREVIIRAISILILALVLVADSQMSLKCCLKKKYEGCVPGRYKFSADTVAIQHVNFALAESLRAELETIDAFIPI